MDKSILFKKLEKIGISRNQFDKYKTSEVERLVLVLNYLEENHNLLLEHLLKLDDFKVSLSSVAASLDISRPTRYKTDAIIELINYFSNKSVSSVNSYFEAKSEKYKELIKQLKYLKDRDIEFIETKMENKELRELVKTLQMKLASINSLT